MSERTALYRIWGDADLLLYIGVSKDFGNRWKQHAKQQPWWDEMKRLTADEWFDSREEAEAAERKAIKAERPKYNVTHNSPPKPERTICYWYDSEWWRVIAYEPGWPDPAHRHLAVQSMSGDIVHAHARRLDGKHACPRDVRECRNCGTRASGVSRCNCVFMCHDSRCGEETGHRHHSNPCCEAGNPCAYAVVQQAECPDCPETWPWPPYEPTRVIVARPCGLGWPEAEFERPRVYVMMSPSKSPADKAEGSSDATPSISAAESAAA